MWGGICEPLKSTRHQSRNVHRRAKSPQVAVIQREVLPQLEVGNHHIAQRAHTQRYTRVRHKHTCAARAGRTGPGRCYRLWTAAEERGMRPHSLPDVQRVDLCGPALTVRAFAGRDPVAFGWFEAPPEDALRGADQLLEALGAIGGDDGKLTRFGEQLLAMPVHPRLGAVVLEGRQLGCVVAAATAATLLSDAENLGRQSDGPRGGMTGDDRGERGADLHEAVEAFLLAEERGFPDSLCREFGSRGFQARGLLHTRSQFRWGFVPMFESVVLTSRLKESSTLGNFVLVVKMKLGSMPGKVGLSPWVVPLLRTPEL